MSGLAVDLFGMPLVMAEDDFQFARNVLRSAWVLQSGRPPGAFEDDLDALADWFHPKLRGATLRAKLGVLGRLGQTGAERLPVSVLLPCGDERFLVTPEGRAWLECAATPRGTTEGQIVFSVEQALPLEKRLLGVYRGWTRHRLEDVIQKRTGSGPPMLPPAIAIVLLLLVNRSLSPETAIRRVRDPRAQAKIDDVVADVLAAFADTLAGPSKRGRSRGQFSLWSGYPLTEARRRLAGQLILDGDEGTVYVKAANEDKVIDFVTRDLARRRDISEDDVEHAFQALVAAYRHRLEDLSRLGSGFERVGRTDALRERLVQAVRDRS
jgi:hypothetical protein